MAAPGSSGPGSASNPRKFSEKIALQRQRQAAETAAFEEVMMDIGSTRLQVQKLRMAHMRGPYYGGSLPNVNQISCGSAEFQGPPQSPLDPSRSTRHQGLVERVHRDPRRMMSPLRRYMRQVDSSPYAVSYLPPHQESDFRRNLPWGNYPSDTGQLFRLPNALNRTSSDSALHTSVMEPYPAPPQGVSTPTRRSAFPFPVLGMEEPQAEGAHLLKPCDAKKLPNASSRPKSWEVPGISIFPSADPAAIVLPVSSVLNTGGSLPDLTNLHFPSPLPTPLDPEESGFGGLSGGSSTGNLASTMTHLGISRMGLPPGYDASGFCSAAIMQNSLSRQTLQSSLSNPNLQSSLSSASLQTSFSNPSLQSSLSSQSLPSSLSNQSLSPSVSSHSLQSAYSTPSSPSSSSSSSFPPLASASLNTSPRRRVPLSPLTLPMAGDSRRTHPKQFSPTMSPTLTSITQGVPLDTSKMPADQRLPPYHYNHPNVYSHSHQSQSSVHESQQPLHQSQQPLHQSQQSLHQSQSSVHESQQPLHQSQQPLHQSQQPMHHSQLPVHDSQQPLHLSQQPMHQSQQPLHQSQQPIHQSQLPAHDSQQPLRHSQSSANESQQPLHQSQHPLHHSQSSLTESRQPLHQSCQSLHQSQRSVHESQQPLHYSQTSVHESQQPLHYSQTSVQQSLHQTRQPSSQNHQQLHHANQALNQRQQPLLEVSQNSLHHSSHKDDHDVPSSMQPLSYQQNSEGLPYQYFLGDYNVSSSLLSSLFDDCDLQLPTQRSGALTQQFGQCNMVDDGHLALSGSSFPGEYPHLHITGLSGSNSCNSQSFKKQNSSNCGRHDPIPNIILTAVDSPPGFSKEITSALSCVPGFEVGQSLGLEEDLNIEPLTLDGLNMLSDPYAPLTDPQVEDSFRCDRLQ